MEKRALDFNPDEFVLTKQDVNDFLNLCLNYLGRTLKQKVRNTHFILALEAMKAGLILTREKDFKIIWTLLLQFIFQLMHENALQKAFKDKEAWGLTLAKIKSSWKDGKQLEKMLLRFTE